MNKNTRPQQLAVYLICRFYSGADACDVLACYKWQIWVATANASAGETKHSIVLLFHRAFEVELTHVNNVK